MHILATTAVGLEEMAAPVDLRQAAAPMAVLSFTDSDLAGLAAAWAAERDVLPDLRLVPLRSLRHPMSVDLWLDRTGSGARVIVLRLLGGLDWWRYGAERLAGLARARGIALAVLPGEDRDDPTLFRMGTMPVEEQAGLLAYWRAGGPANLRALLRRMGGYAGTILPAAPPVPLPLAGALLPADGPVPLPRMQAALPPDRPVVPIIFYRSMLLAEDARPVAALFEALAARGIAPAPLFVASLKEADSVGFLQRALPALRPEVIVTTTAFAAGEQAAVLTEPGVPVLQAIMATTPRAAWATGPRGLGAADLAMHVVLPELDGRVLAGPLSFKGPPADLRSPADHRSPADDGSIGGPGGESGQDGRPPALHDFAGTAPAGPAPTGPGPAAPGPAGLAPTGPAPAVPAPVGRGLAGPCPTDPGTPGRGPVGRGLAGPCPATPAPPGRGPAGPAPAGPGPAGRGWPAGSDHDLERPVRQPRQSGDWPASPNPAQAVDGEPDVPGFERQTNRPEPDRVAQAADRIAALTRLRRTPAAERRVAVLLPDYPGAGGRTGYAVGLDVPTSVLALLDDLTAAGYGVGSPPGTPGALLAALANPTPGLTLAEYAGHFAALPEAARAGVLAAWGEAADDPAVSGGAFRFRSRRHENLTLAVAPDRGRTEHRRADWHDPALPPRHALLAFGFWLRHRLDVHAVVHMGAHGSLEWLPGKAVALTASCYPETVLGSLPVIYPFLVSNAGEAAQARRRIGAVTLGHLPPRLAGAGLHGATRELERLLDELAAADGLDRRRRDRLVRLVLQAAATEGLLDLSPEAAPEAALRRVDAWLCDLKELAIKDGLHVYGRAEAADDPLRTLSAAAERAALLAALDGRHIPPGPGGSPQRGRTDVLPTGRNLFALDPRSLPTPTAMELGRSAAEEVLRLHLQEHGEMPGALVLDLWGSATLRTGGEEIALGLALMGCRPTWDDSGSRVTGVEVLPPAVMGRPRVDVTWRVSGLFRDLFPAQIALIDAATRAVAARDELATENPLAAARQSGGPLARIFGTAPGAYGAGVEEALASGNWSAREDLGRAYLAAASHTYSGVEGHAEPAPGGFAARIAAAQALVHIGDDPARDLLDGGADVAHLGGFAAAAAALGTRPALLTLDTTETARPRARPLAQALARLVHGRVSPGFIAGQMRHGPRGAAELAETVDRLVAFAETTSAVPDALLDRVHDAYLGDPVVLGFLRRENPAAARAIAARFEAARRRGLWHPRRNGVDAELREAAAP